MSLVADYRQSLASRARITIPAIIGAWYNEEQGRYLLFYLAHIPDFENIEIPYDGLEQMWSDLLGGLTCHIT